MFSIRSITVDCVDPYRQAQFWSAATGWLEDPDDPNRPGDPEGRIVSGHGINLLFIPVPESKSVKNRMHLDLRIGADGQEAEVARLTGLGARELWRGAQGPHSWVTMADPEGNEFCVA